MSYHTHFMSSLFNFMSPNTHFMSEDIHFMSRLVYFMSPCTTIITQITELGRRMLIVGHGVRGTNRQTGRPWCAGTATRMMWWPT